jgi:hypothetical protein
VRLGLGHHRQAQFCAGFFAVGILVGCGEWSGIEMRCAVSMRSKAGILGGESGIGPLRRFEGEY